MEKNNKDTTEWARKCSMKKNRQSMTRQYEYFRIKYFIDDALDGSENRFLLITGEPNVAKSNTLGLVCEAYDDNAQIHILYISARRAKSCDGVIDYLGRELLFKDGGTPKARSSILRGLNQYFTTQHETFTIFIIDDFEQLEPKNMSLFWNIMEFLQNDDSKFIIITVSTNIDIMEKLMPEIILKNLKITRLEFNTYNFAELQKLLEEKMCETFDFSAWKVLTRNMLYINSDYKNYFKVAEKAFENAQDRNSKTISVADVTHALIYYSRPREPAIRSLDHLHKVFLLEMSNLGDNFNAENVVIYKICQKVQVYYEKMKMPIPSEESILEAAKKLQKLGLIYEISKVNAESKIQGNFIPDCIKRFKF